MKLTHMDEAYWAERRIAAEREFPGSSYGVRPDLTAEVVDLGRGTPEEFEAHAADIKGRIVLVRHELMFAATEQAIGGSVRK